MYLSQTELGILFGVSSHKIGRWLTALGLRYNGTPSEQAHHDGYVSTRPHRNKGYYWRWHGLKTVAALERAGHVQIGFPPIPSLHGPFTTRQETATEYVILNGDGSYCVSVMGLRNAEIMAKALSDFYTA